MIAKEIIKEVSHDGTIKLQVPEYSGQKVKILFFPMSKDTDEEERLDFLAATYLAAIEDDEEEDAIWEKYIK
jgi:hypothetical protein